MLGTLGYTGDLDAEMPRQKREVIFGKGELTRSILDELRGATEPLGSREIAQAIVALSGQDARDRKHISLKNQPSTASPRSGHPETRSGAVFATSTVLDADVGQR